MGQILGDSFQKAARMVWEELKSSWTKDWDCTCSAAINKWYGLWCDAFYPLHQSRGGYERSGEDITAKQSVPYAEDDIKPLLRVAHISRYHYEERTFDILFVRWTERWFWLRGMYGGISEHNMVGRCRGEDDQSTVESNNVIGKMDTAVAI